MLTTSEISHGTTNGTEVNGHSNGALVVREALNERTEHRLPPLATLPPVRQEESPSPRTSLALFCYDAPGSVVGEFVSHLAGALVRRQLDVHIFTRRGFEVAVPSISIHVLGECDEGDLLAQVHEFNSRACNAFLKQFPNGCARVSLLGFEWSTIPVLSILRGIKGLPTILSLHSLERQRSDMSSEISRAIDSIEMSGLREAKAVLIHEPATGELARQLVPECADRVAAIRQRFAVEQFQAQLDPGAIKAKYQVGPVDPTILYIGDLGERYGPEVLLKAMPAVLKNHKQARLIMVGEGALYWPLRVYTRYLLLEHAVRLAGHVQGPALHELIQAADVIAVPSREATPWWPILAAWAARRPVVATHEAAPGLLEHEQDSVLVYSTPNSYVWGIERVLFDPELAATIAHKGRQKLEDRFGWNAVAAQVEELAGVAAVAAT